MPSLEEWFKAPDNLSPREYTLYRLGIVKSFLAMWDTERPFAASFFRESFEAELEFRKRRIQELQNVQSELMEDIRGGLDVLGKNPNATLWDALSIFVAAFEAEAERHSSHSVYRSVAKTAADAIADARSFLPEPE